MSFGELVKKIPTSMYEELADKFMDVLLEAKEGGNIPSSIAKAILYYSMQDKLASEACLVDLLEAVALAEPERGAEILEAFGLEEIRQALKPAD